MRGNDKDGGVEELKGSKGIGAEGIERVVARARKGRAHAGSLYGIVPWFSGGRASCSVKEARAAGRGAEERGGGCG